MTKHVFLSFVVEDKDLVNLLRGQAKNKQSDLSFDDYSVKDPINSTIAPYIKLKITDKIRACSVTICLVGTTTATSSWVDWEIQTSTELGKKVIGVRLHSDAVKDKPPKALVGIGAKVLNWDIEKIVAELR